MIKFADTEEIEQYLFIVWNSMYGFVLHRFPNDPMMS